MLSNGRISGPVSAHYTYFDGVKFNFYGDAHASTKNSCENCSVEKNCYSIIDILKQNFSYADETNKYIDFYLEMPFKSKSIGKETISRFKEVGYIGEIERFFGNCLVKTDCPYKNTRFHYIDVRQAFWKESMLWGYLALVYLKLVSFDFNLAFFYVDEAPKILKEMMTQNQKIKNQKIEEYDYLIKNYYEYYKNLELFNIILTSDNYIEDVKKLFSDIKSTSSLNKLFNETLFNKEIIVEREGKIMHRSRAQLEGLEKDEKKNLSNKILNFMKKELNSKVNLKILDYWNSFMILYNGYISSKIKSEKILDFFTNINYEEIQTASSQSGSLIMDAYTLARMFRTFDSKKHDKSFKTIIYAGEMHINVYVKFFKNELNSPVTSYTNYYDASKFNPDDYNRCLNVDISQFIEKKQSYL